jgi:hypothetical protein
MNAFAITALYVAGSVVAQGFANRFFRDSAVGKVVGLASTPGLILLCLVAAPLYLVALRFAIAAPNRREQKFIERMKTNGRFRSWEETEARRGKGTVMIEQAQKSHHRVWWTPDDVTTSAPDPIPDEEKLDYMRARVPRPFVTWCAEKYTSPTTGTALLTEFPVAFPPGFVTSEFVRGKFPEVRVVMTARLS